VAFIDSDAVALEDASDIFKCGTFCAVFIDACTFNSGVMVLTPSSIIFEDMLQALLTKKIYSMDGADQGFLNSKNVKKAVIIILALQPTSTIYLLHPCSILRNQTDYFQNQLRGLILFR
jgi:hypothetical protein